MTFLIRLQKIGGFIKHSLKKLFIVYRARAINTSMSPNAIVVRLYIPKNLIRVFYYFR